MQWISRSETHQGLVRENNEDAYFACDARGLWLLADGMGGHNGGEVASRMACDLIEKQLSEGQSLHAAITFAHQEILTYAQANPCLAGMGTTVVAAQWHRRKLLLAWVGDSRIYLLRNGELSQLSVDHSFVQDMVAKGVLSEEEANNHPQKNLLRQALGQTKLGHLAVDIKVHAPKPGDLLLLCSDGVHDMLTPAELKECLLSNDETHQQAEALSERILSTGARDNFSYILLDFQLKSHRRLFGKITSFTRKSQTK